jgi:hypothetical protein
MSDAIPRQVAARRGFSISYKGKTLLSTIDPIAQGDRVVAAAPKIARTLYLCPSPLYGYGIDRLLTTIQEGSAILCIEADEKLLALSMQAMGELLAKHPSLRLVGSCDPALLCGYIRNTWGSRSFRRVEVLRLSGGWQLFPGLYESLAEAIQRDIVIDWGNAMTLMKLGRRYISNAIRNLALIPKAHPLGELDFGDSPVLVLGAGPSLDAVMDGLHCFFRGNLSEMVRPFRVICVDTALQALKDRNIKPDLVVALESQHWNLQDFIGSGSWEVPVAMDLSALPATQEVLGGQTFLFATPWTKLHFFHRLNVAGLLPETFPPLGSVGLTAVALARHIASGPLIIGGIDFSYTLERFHARSTPGHREGLRRQTRFRSLLNGDAAFSPGAFTVLSKSGLTVRTNPAMKQYQDLFKQEFAGDPRIQDITGPGLPLGVGTLSLEEACQVLQTGKPPVESSCSRVHREEKKQESLNATKAFIRRERDTLLLLRDMLTGTLPISPEKLEVLLDEGDYLWAHFPECAGAEGRRPSGRDLSFLKRVRTEIDPLVECFDLALEALD